MRRLWRWLLTIVGILLPALVLMLAAWYVMVLSPAINIEPRRSDLRPMPTGLPLLLSPQWSPDGTHITFGFRGEIYTIDINSMILQSVHSVGEVESDEASGASPNVAFSPSMSPDGSRVAYNAFEHSTWVPWAKEYDWDIVTSDLDGSGKRRLTDNGRRDLYPVWSPDGNRIALVSIPDIYSHIHVMRPDGSDVRSVAPSVVAWRYSPPVWSADGRSIAFLSQDEDVATCDHDRVVQRFLYTVEMDRGEPELIGLVLDKTLPAWSPDGRRLAFSSVNGGAIMYRRGGGERSGVALQNRTPRRLL